MSHLAATKNWLSDCKKPRFKRFATNWTKGNKIKKKGRRKKANNKTTHLARRSIRNPGVVGSGLSGGPMT